MGAALLTFPMHGQHKLSTEGYRTRDGHIIEWFGRLLLQNGTVEVLSRPEPRAVSLWRDARRLRTKSEKSSHVAENTVPISMHSMRIPHPWDRQRWWVDSLPAYKLPAYPSSTPVVSWNPFLALSSAWPEIAATNRLIVFDLLDDWTIHYAFKTVSRDVHKAYERLFARADVVTANALGTVELARRFGRTDVEFIPNGCDPERFDTDSSASGATTVGYVGKIGKRLDLDLIVQTARALPDVRFVFAGPILDAEYRAPLEMQKNIEVLGDVHYDDVPQLLRRFDVGWVPHRVGEGEVGGDVIKTYEYRAAGLPVLTTPIEGARERAMEGVEVVPREHHVAAIQRLCLISGPRIPRQIISIPQETTWKFKAQRLLEFSGASN